MYKAHKLSLLATLSLVLLSSSFSLSATPKKSKVSEIIPFDTNVKTGKLSNGFTYYIRHNEEPKNRVTIYLANKVGSVLETEDERGLAHFMEHMSFNGTKNFPKNELVSYLQKSGIKFGSDLNAYTSFDETVYQLPLPTDDPQLLRNGFQIMRDWAQEATLDSIEIEKERGVVLEEKRLHTNAQQRMQDVLFPILANNSIYSSRQTIGTDKVLTEFKRATILDFYRKWYRPDLQALIVVGDIDVEATEKTIKAMFSDLKNPKKGPVRTKHRIELTGKNQFVMFTDKELQMPTVEIMSKYEKEPLRTRTDYKRNLTRSIYNYIVSERFSDLSKQPNSPFVNAGSGAGPFLANMDANTTTIVAQAANMEKAVKTVWTEIARIKKIGFTAEELARAKQALISNIEGVYKEKDKTPSENYVNEYVRYFLDQEASPGISYELQLSKELLADISTADVNLCAVKYFSTINRDIIVTGPEKERDNLPQESQILDWMRSVENTSVTVIQSEYSEKVLMTQQPQSGKVIKVTNNSRIGTTELLLSNGLKVVLKPTDFKNDEIAFAASSPGGTSLYSDKDFQSANVASKIVQSAGLANFNLSQLQKFLAGKRISVSPYISERYEGFNGSSAPADFETALQMICLYFTQPRKDFSVFNGELERAKSSLPTRWNNPTAVFTDSVSAILNNYNLRRTGPSVEKLNQIDPERAYAIFKERFADASDFTFTFVGAIDTANIKPLLEQYLGSLPAINRKETPRDLGIQIPTGKIDKKVYKGVDNKSTVRLVFSGTYAYGEDENFKLDAVADLLTIKLIEKLREEESGVYGVGASAKFVKYPQSRYYIMISFGCAPANVDKLISAANEVIAQMKNQLPQQDDVEKVVSESLRSMEVQHKTNDFWLNFLVQQQQDDENPTNILSYKEELKKITPAVLLSTAKQYLGGDNYASLVLYPEK